MARRQLDAWLEGRPLDDASLAAYLGHLHEAGREPATAAMVVAAVKRSARDAGTAVPIGPLTRRADVRRLVGSCAAAVRSLHAVISPEPGDAVVGLSVDQINRFAAACAAAGLDGRRTSHAGRVGLAVELTARRASTHAIHLAGGWKDPPWSSATPRASARAKEPSVGTCALPADKAGSQGRGSVPRSRVRPSWSGVVVARARSHPGVTRAQRRAAGGLHRKITFHEYPSTPPRHIAGSDRRSDRDRRRHHRPRPGRRRAPCAADVAEGRRKVLEMLRETVKVAIDARDDGAATAVADVLQRLGMWIEAEPPGGKGMGA